MKRRRYPSRYSRYPKKKAFKKAVAKALYSLAEHKWIQGNATATSLTTLSPLSSVCNLILPGNQENSRIGTKMTMLSMSLRYQIIRDPNLGGPVSVRCFVIESLDENDPDALPGIPVALFPTLSQSNSRYKVWYDRCHDMSSNVHENVNVFKRIDLKKHQIRMDGISNVFLKGKLVVYFVTDNPTTNAIAIDVEHRVIYNDS